MTAGTDTQADIDRVNFQLTLRRRGISDQAVLRAMGDVSRTAFVSADLAASAYADQALPIDGVSGATRPAGEQRLHFEQGKAPLGELPAGRYKLVVEAAREVGGREVLTIPFEWPPQSPQHLEAQGKSELGALRLDLDPS